MRRRVLFVINGLGTGGTERSTVELIPHLRDAGLDPSFACFYRRDTGVEAGVIESGVPVHFVAGRRTLVRARRLRRLIADERPALVHTMHFEADLAGRLAAAGRRIPVVSSLVSTPYARARRSDPRVSSWRLRTVQSIDGWTGRRLVDRFHAVSETVKAAAVQALGLSADRVTVVLRGRDERRLGEPSTQRRRCVRARLGLSEDDEVVLQVGRQEFAKGQADLVRAAASLLRRRPRAVVLVAGREGNASSELARLIGESGCDPERLRLLGHREDVPDLLAAADLFVFPSLYEGMPGAVIEAMALGLPVVATDIPAIREVTEPGGNALLVPAGDSSRLAAALEALLDDRPLASAYGARSREIFLHNFTLERYAQGMIRMYRDLLET